MVFGIRDEEFKKLETKVLDALANTLPTYLTYHCVKHTQGVLSDAIQIAQYEQVSATDLMKIKIAALLHDTGFMTTYQNHEEASCVYAKEILSAYNIVDNDVQHICEMIMATKIPQSPQDHCGQILADADLAYLGTDRFSEISSLLYNELIYINPSLDIQKWNQIQINFLSQHKYFTNYCIKNYAEQKETHLQKLITELKT